MTPSLLATWKKKSYLSSFTLVHVFSFTTTISCTFFSLFLFSKGKQKKAKGK
ncbi:uncharacterized protein DS421_15g491740 [Arachis hypogaea]|nr:uncharacterized protein DS421_15g491740 [Arachis hypogaea]